jgi:hypothetical protein
MQTRTSTLAPVAAALAAATVIAACGSSSPGSRPSHANSTTQGVKFAQCMRANGVPNLPDPTGHTFGIKLTGPNSASVNGVSVHAPAFGSALRQCQQDMPQRPAPTTEQLAQYRAKAVRFGQCMRRHGIDIPDPQIGPGPGDQGIGRQIDIPSGMTQNSPAYEAATQTCERRTGF